MNRKNIIITDNNYDEEWEKLCDIQEWTYGKNNQFVEQLPKGFSENTNKENADDYDYSKVTFEPNIAIDAASAIETYQMAWEFKNGFMIVSDRDSMYD